MNSNSILQTFAVASNYPSIRKVGIFGSYARGEENENSDVDILIDYDETLDDYAYDMGGFMEDIEQHITVKIDYITLPGLMKSKNSQFKEQVLNDVKWLYVADTQGEAS